jgi:alkylhydroperoxidase family enzyme
MSTRLATVRPVEEAAATGKVAEIFADIKRTKKIDFVPNMWRVLATNPDELELVWHALKPRMHPEAAGRTSSLDAQTREIIALAVSATTAAATGSTHTPSRSRNSASPTKPSAKCSASSVFST